MACRQHDAGSGRVTVAEGKLLRKGCEVIRFTSMTAMAVLVLALPAQAKDAPKPRQELKCSSSDTPEEEAEKEIRYVVDGKEHIEYCVMGKKQIIIDSGDNG